MAILVRWICPTQTHRIPQFFQIWYPSRFKSISNRTGKSVILENAIERYPFDSPSIQISQFRPLPFTHRFWQICSCHVKRIPSIADYAFQPVQITRCPCCSVVSLVASNLSNIFCCSNFLHTWHSVGTANGSMLVFMRPVPSFAGPEQ